MTPNKVLEAQINRLARVANICTHAVVDCNEGMKLMKDEIVKLQERVTELEKRNE